MWGAIKTFWEQENKRPFHSRDHFVVHLWAIFSIFSFVSSLSAPLCPGLFQHVKMVTFQVDLNFLDVDKVAQGKSGQWSRLCFCGKKKSVFSALWAGRRQHASSSVPKRKKKGACSLSPSPSDCLWAWNTLQLRNAETWLELELLVSSYLHKNVVHFADVWGPRWNLNWLFLTCGAVIRTFDDTLCDTYLPYSFPCTGHHIRKKHSALRSEKLQKTQRLHLRFYKPQLAC